MIQEITPGEAESPKAFTGEPLWNAEAGFFTGRMPFISSNQHVNRWFTSKQLFTSITCDAVPEIRQMQLALLLSSAAEVVETLDTCNLH